MSETDARFGLRRGDFALDVAFRLPARGITTLSGRSGSGKTTLLRCLAGLERPESGRLSLGRDVWFDASRGLDVPTHRRAVGYVTQQAHLFPHLSVRGNLAFGWNRSGGREADLDLEHIAGQLGLGTLLDRSVDGLSGGECQRVAIGRALLSGPKILLLDEPVSSLDIFGREEVLEVLERLLSRLPIPCVYVSHDLGEAARLADQMLWLNAGRIQASGPVQQVLSDLALPFAQERDSESIVLGRIAERDAASGLAWVAFPGGGLWISGEDAPAGGDVRVQIRARDVSLALERPEQISVLNILEGRVEGLAEAGTTPSQVLVRVDIGGSLLLSRVTRRSARELGLAPGTRVWALVKSAAIRR